uniref:Uncharacterized protein n=1 Tax=Molossus molossus TaxID=27622 RepID=A0A7J8BYB7_MOLMO|nr:hypothetical protein HJG59_010012 [Molossus molossus]
MIRQQEQSPCACLLGKREATQHGAPRGVCCEREASSPQACRGVVSRSEARPARPAQATHGWQEAEHSLALLWKKTGGPLGSQHLNSNKIETGPLSQRQAPPGLVRADSSGSRVLRTRLFRHQSLKWLSP